MGGRYGGGAHGGLLHDDLVEDRSRRVHHTCDHHRGFCAPEPPPTTWRNTVVCVWVWGVGVWVWVYGLSVWHDGGSCGVMVSPQPAQLWLSGTARGRGEWCVAGHGRSQGCAPLRAGADLA